MLILFIELLIWAVCALFATTQIIIPLWNNTLLFPIFRDRRKIEAELRAAREAKDNAELEQVIENTRSAIPEVKKKATRKKATTTKI